MEVSSETVVGSFGRTRRPMAPQNKPVTLRDLEAQGNASADTSGVLLLPGGPNNKWTMNVGAWAVLLLVANIVRPPALIMLVLNAALLTLNLEAVRKAGKGNTPMWIYVLIGCQILVTLQYGWYTADAFF